jgi:heme exporter protein CcmD
MKAQFDSLQQLWQMAGHGPYVWTAVLVSLAVLGWLLIRPVQQHRANLRAIVRQSQREQLQQAATEPSQENN